MTAARGDEEVVAGLQDHDLRAVRKFQARAAGKQRHPFMRRLVVPEPLGAGLPCGDNALQAEVPGLEEVLTPFLGQLRRQPGKEVVDRGDARLRPLFIFLQSPRIL